MFLIIITQTVSKFHYHKNSRSTVVFVYPCDPTITPDNRGSTIVRCFCSAQYTMPHSQQIIRIHETLFNNNIVSTAHGREVNASISYNIVTAARLGSNRKLLPFSRWIFITCPDHGCPSDGHALRRGHFSINSAVAGGCI